VDWTLTHATPALLVPQLLLLNAIECSGMPKDVRLVELLLQCGLSRGLGLEHVNKHGETALHAAVRKGNVKVSVRAATVGA
jgi:hypothetical protein